MKNIPVVEELKRNGQITGLIVTWNNLKKDDEAEWIEAIGDRRTVVVFGDFGRDGNCNIVGSNDKTNVGNLQQNFDRDLNIKSANEFIEISGLSRFIRPMVTGEADLTIQIMVIL